MSSEYLACSFLISGCSLASACIERNCLTASGSSAARTTIVSRMIESPQLAPIESWKKVRMPLKTSISGWRTFARIMV